MRSAALVVSVLVLSGCALFEAPTVVADCRPCVKPLPCDPPYFEVITSAGEHKCLAVIYGDAVCPGEEEGDDGNR